jgi:hypothetical protein
VGSGARSPPPPLLLPLPVSLLYTPEGARCEPADCDAAEAGEAERGVGCAAAKRGCDVQQPQALRRVCARAGR